MTRKSTPLKNERIHDFSSMTCYFYNKYIQYSNSNSYVHIRLCSSRLWVAQNTKYSFEICSYPALTFNSVMVESKLRTWCARAHTRTRTHTHSHTHTHTHTVETLNEDFYTDCTCLWTQTIVFKHLHRRQREMKRRRSSITCNLHRIIIY
jgi:hypothetical protein